MQRWEGVGSVGGYHRARGTYLECIDAISWEFKRERFERTLVAIHKWQPLGESRPTLNFFPVGDLWGTAKANGVQIGGKGVVREREALRGPTGTGFDVDGVRGSGLTG